MCRPAPAPAGLPLIFSHEIQHWLHADLAPKAMPATTPKASLDQVLTTARNAEPGQTVQFISADPEDDRLWFVTLAATLDAEENQRDLMIDSRTAALIGKPKFDQGLLSILMRLHVDLFAGVPGSLLLGAMGLLLVVAIVSGVVLYAPFVRKLTFGTVRHDAAAQTKWLDLHNLLGVVCLVWMLVVSLTGVINTLGQPLLKLWQITEVADRVAPYRHLPAPTKLGSVQTAVAAAQAVEPSMHVFFVAFPGTAFSSTHHYSIFMHGNTPLTKRLFKPVLVDAQTSQVTDHRAMPWYMTVLFVSQPLHFGDYGGIGIKIIWALLAVLTIMVLASGLYLWAKKRAKPVTHHLLAKTMAAKQ